MPRRFTRYRWTFPRLVAAAVWSVVLTAVAAPRVIATPTVTAPRVVATPSVTAPPRLVATPRTDAPQSLTDQPPSISEVPWRLGYDLALDTDGAVEQRVTLGLERGRLIWWSSGTTVAVHEETVPAGMVERRYAVHNPLVDTTHRVGVTAGPVTFGPVRPLGGYHRALDPTTGGVAPTAESGDTRLALDGGLDPSAWDGLEVRYATPPNQPTGGHVGAALLYDENRGEALLASATLSPWDGRFGELGVVAAGGRPLTAGRAIEPQWSEDSWVFPEPPDRTNVVRLLGASVGWRRPAGVAVPAAVEAFGFRQGAAYRPRRHAGGGTVVVGPRRVRVLGRYVTTERGFRRLIGGEPSKGRFLAGRIEGILRFPDRFKQRYRIEWRLDGERDRGWEDGMLEDPEERITAAIKLRGTGTLAAIGLAGEYPSRKTVASVALATPLTVRWWLKPELRGRYRFKPDSSARRFSVEARLALAAEEPRHPLLVYRASAESDDDGADAGILAWEHDFQLEIPVGPAGTLRFGVTATEPATDRAELVGLLRYRWYRSGVLEAED